MLQQIWTIARNTFIESIRQPIFVVVMFIATLAMLLNPSLAAYTLENDNKMLIDMGLSTLFIVGLFLGAFTATGVVSSEIENKTALTVISKPVSRPIFILGKYVGVSGALALAYWTLTVIYLMTVRHKVMQTASDPFDGPVIIFGLGFGILAILVATLGNYFYNWVFTSAVTRLMCVFLTIGYALVLLIDKQWHFQNPMIDIDPQLLIGLLLVLMAVIVLCSVAIVASTRLGQLMTLMVCLGVFLLGIMSQNILGTWANDYWWADVVYRITPNLQFLWPADAISQEHDFTGTYVMLVTSYSALMICSMLGLAIALFQTREIG
ncbi:MAG: ABC transporter permease [Phycisphaeraceae bacterium]|nr:ABC transporter permease [Phycisphaeraceae bacterium]